MSDRELMYLTDFAALMATRKYEKVPAGHPIGSQLGVDFGVCTQRSLVLAGRISNFQVSEEAIYRKRMKLKAVMSAFCRWEARRMVVAIWLGVGKAMQGGL